MINTALIGFGLAGRVFHAPLIEACEGLKLTKIMSSRKDEILNAYPNAQAVSSIDEVINGDEQLIVIASPNDTHFEFAKKALEAGKHVVVDKPLTPTLEEARELEKIAKNNERELIVFHNRRFDGDFLTIKKLIEKATIGKPFYLESNFHRFRPEVNKANWRETTDKAGGIFFDLGPHLLDQALALFGTPDKAFADIATQRKDALNDDNFHVVLYYGEARVHLNASTLYNAPPARFILNGDKGSFVKYGMDPQEARLKEGKYYSAIGDDVEQNFGTLFLEEQEKVITEAGNYLGFYENVSDKISEKVSELEVKTTQAIFVMEMMEALLKSASEGRVVQKGKDYDLA